MSSKTPLFLTSALLFFASCQQSGSPADAADPANSGDRAVEAAASDNGAEGSGNAANNEQEVRTFLEQVYAMYGPGSDMPGSENYALNNRHNEQPELYFEPVLAREVGARYQIAAASDRILDMNLHPFCGCQDWEPFTIDIRNLEIDGDRATAEVSFRNFGQLEQQMLDLVRTSAGWRVYDIRYGYGDGQEYSYREEVLG